MTQFEKTDLMTKFAEIELLVLLERAFNCVSIDAVIGCSVVAKLEPSVCAVLLKQCFEISYSTKCLFPCFRIRW